MVEALITGAVAIVVCMVNNIFQNKRSEEQHNTTVALVEYRLKQLEDKVELHNNAVERLTKVELALSSHERVAEEKFKAEDHRLKELERSN